MLRKELLDEVVRLTGQKKTNVRVVLKQTFRTMRAVLDAGENLDIYGLGHWQVIWVGRQSHRSKRTGEVRHFRQRRKIIFRLSKHSEPE